MSEREERLWHLTRKHVTGEMTNEEEKEYRLLQEEQSARLSQAMTRIARRNVGKSCVVVGIITLVLVVSLLTGFLVYWAVVVQK